MCPPIVGVICMYVYVHVRTYIRMYVCTYVQGMYIINLHLRGLNVEKRAALMGHTYIRMYVYREVR